jgi:hypothetical protein
LLSPSGRAYWRLELRRDEGPKHETQMPFLRTLVWTVPEAILSRERAGLEAEEEGFEPSIPR